MVEQDESLAQVFVQRITLAEIAGSVKEFLLSRTSPVVLEGACKDWEAMAVCTRLQSEFANHATSWRMIPIQNGNKTVREAECEHVRASFGDFFSWARREGTTNAFESFDPSQIAAYADYKHMPELFPDASPIELDWASFGFEYETSQSTIWVGSQGAHTPLHFDTYGVNLVAQLHGSKTWLLFPPDATSALQALRVPYEESSVYAEADGRSMLTALRGHANLTGHEHGANPLVAEVSAGDMLWVPRHFWHYVECCSDVTVSANLWIDIPEDIEARVEEGLVRFLLGGFVSAVEESSVPCDVEWASSEEEAESLTDHTLNAQMLFVAMRDWSLHAHGRLPSAHPEVILRKIATTLLTPETMRRLRHELADCL